MRFWGIIIHKPTTHSALWLFKTLTGLNQKIHLLVLCHSIDFKTPWELWNSLNKVVPGKFHGFGGHKKCDCLQDQANFHRSRTWQIVLILTLEMNHSSVLIFTFATLYLFKVADILTNDTWDPYYRHLISVTLCTRHGVLNRRQHDWVFFVCFYPISMC